MSEKINLTILVAPLDWGLGHATRCIPIITHLVQLGCKVIIAAEGAQENLLKTEFPDLTFVHLPGYRIQYSSDKRFFALKIITQLPKIFLSIRRERRWLQDFIAHTPVDLVISDNRYGLTHPTQPSVIVTHQLLIKAPFVVAEKILQIINYRLIKKFTNCWVPDEKGDVNMGGILSHPLQLPKIAVDYLGGLSRLTEQPSAHRKIDLLIILSGPEPQRSLLEKKMLKELRSFAGTALLVRGLPGNSETVTVAENIIVKNHLPAKELATAFCKSDLIISRSGYTTVMDICKLQKKAVLIPTPGQTEQEYLAAHLETQGWCITISQDDFSLKRLSERLQNFQFKLPHLDMDQYKEAISDFIKTIKK